MKKFFLTVFFVLSCVQVAHGACSLGLEAPGLFNVTSTYESAVSADAEGTYNFSVKNMGDEDACKFSVSFSGGVSNDPAKRRMHLPTDASNSGLEYTIVKPEDGQVLSDPHSNGFMPANVVSGTLGKGETKALSVKVRIKQGQFVPYSRQAYQDSVAISLYNAAASEINTATPVVGTQNLKFETQVKPEVRIFLGALSDNVTLQSRRENYRIDFGELTQGKTEQMALHVISNDGYQVTFNSENGGQFRHTTSLDMTIPYTMTVNSVPYTLEGAAMQSAENAIKEGASSLILPNTPKSRLALQFTVGSTRGALAGNYRDVVVVTVRSGS